MAARDEWRESPAVQRLVRILARHDRQLKGLATTPQLAHSSVPVIVDGEDEPVEVRLPVAIGEGVRAGKVADDAQQRAVDAMKEAAKATQTADGKNRITASATEPTYENPAQGDLWYELGDEAQVVGVRVWNGDEWVAYTLVADQILVPSSIGPILIADGAVTAPKVNVDEALINKLFVNDLLVLALTGKAITGARVRTAASGNRVELFNGRLTLYGNDGNLVGELRAQSSGQNAFIDFMGPTIGGDTPRIRMGDIYGGYRAELSGGPVSVPDLHVEHLHGPDGADRLAMTPNRVAFGSFSTTGAQAAGAFTDIVVNFPEGRFAAAPFVVTNTSQVRIASAVTDVSATQMTIRVYNVTSGTAAGNCIVRWQAMSNVT